MLFDFISFAKILFYILLFENDDLIYLTRNTIYLLEN